MRPQAKRIQAGKAPPSTRLNGAFRFLSAPSSGRASDGCGADYDRSSGLYDRQQILRKQRALPIGPRRASGPPLKRPLEVAQVAEAHLTADAGDTQVGLLDQESPGFLYPMDRLEGLKAHAERLLKQRGQVRLALTGLMREAAQGDLFPIMVRQIRQRLLKPRMKRPKARKLPSPEVP